MKKVVGYILLLLVVSFVAGCMHPVDSWREFVREQRVKADIRRILKEKPVVEEKQKVSEIR